ncbi:MAG TPA: pitrilysin family protein [Candidatus Lustribacter sp.]|nr:pitrilysin family protein [Candidatus Lustribacter sp.]
MSLALAAAASAAPQAESTANNVLKATLRNGLQVVIVRNTLAPVASTDLSYLVGSRDDPPDMPGLAHAQEHMMFRGTKNLSTAELGTIATALGGEFNAETSELTTQYQFTVPAADLDAVLRIESDRMRGVLDLQSQWQNERGAIEQEVARDEAAPGGDFFSDAQAIAFKGTVYEHPGVGTKAAFDALTGPRLKAFWQRWYAPNNAVLVIAGDVDPAATLAVVRSRFESIPEKTVPAHQAAHFQPLKRTVLRRPTTLAYPLAAVGFRLPGLNDPDFLASFVLQGVLGADRGALHQLGDDGLALEGEWSSTPYYPEGQLSFAVAALAPGNDPDAMVKRLEDMMTNIRDHGVPPELFESTKRKLIAEQELSRNSITSLASDWADTIAVDREPSIAYEQELIGRITLADVNRVAKRYLDVNHAIIGSLTPSAGANQSGAPQPPAGTGRENPLGKGPAITHLPAWGSALVQNVTVPPSSLNPQAVKLANGITLIVQPETISDSVFVYGSVKTAPSLQEPIGQEGIARLVEGMYPYGTQTQDRETFQRALDAADTELAGGSSFGMQTTSRTFDRAVSLLAANELQPRLDQATFDVVKRRGIDELSTELNSTHTIAVQEAAQKLLPFNDPELRQPTIAGMQGLSLDQAKAYYAKTMRPDLATIVVVGNVSPAQARATIERAFGGWHASGPAPAVDLPAVPLNRPGDVKIPLPNIHQDYVTLEQLVPLPRSAPQYYPLVLGNAVLGGGSLGPEQSRLFRDIRQNAGLVYSIDSQYVSGGARSRFSISFACAEGNEPRIEAMIDAELAQLRKDPIGDFELGLMKASAVRRAVLGDASASDIGEALLNYATNGLPLDETHIDAQHLLATDAHAIQDAFVANIHPEDFVRTIEGP